ncbi:hypothetical protein QTP88_025155 [Uroleucon formosanum]
MDYFSIDTVVDSEETVHFPTEFLNSQTPSGMPLHKISLKVGVPIILLRNWNSPRLCNGTRLRVTSLTKNVIEAEFFIGCAKREKIFLPKIPLHPNEFLVKFRRVQFPINVCFTMTINKAQGREYKLVDDIDQYRYGCDGGTQEEQIIVSMSAHKKQKTYYFHQEFEIGFFFTMLKDKYICLICRITISTTKKGYLERRFRTACSKFDIDFPPKTKARKQQLKKLKLEIDIQQDIQLIFNKPVLKSKAAIITVLHFQISHVLAKNEKSFQTGEIVKQAFLKGAHA